MNEELSIANQELENLSQAKSDFVSMVSHELRTPLTSIIGFSELLAEAHIGELSEEQEEYIRQILRKGKDLLALINDLLDTGRLESGKLALRYREVDMPLIARDHIDRRAGVGNSACIGHGLGPIRGAAGIRIR